MDLLQATCLTDKEKEILGDSKSELPRLCGTMWVSGPVIGVHVPARQQGFCSALQMLGVLSAAVESLHAMVKADSRTCCGF